MRGLGGAAQDEVRHHDSMRLAPQTASPSCNAGIVYDDGGFEAAYAVGPAAASMVMKLDLVPTTTAFDQVCIGLTRTSGAPSSVTVNIVIYDDNGPGGSPGTFLGGTSAVASSIPAQPGAAFYAFDLSGSGVVLPAGSVYVGAHWQAFYSGGTQFIDMLGDRSAGTPLRASFESTNNGGSWTSMSSVFPTAIPRAMAIRADPGTTPSTCTPSATTMCLNNNRFAVSASFQTPTQSGVAQVVKLTPDTGYFWFFSSSNVEAVVKIINGCSLNNRYWVFAGGLTDVDVHIVVTDTAQGTTRTYDNNQGVAFQPIQDTGAFHTCP